MDFWSVEWAVGLSAEIALLSLLIKTRIYKPLPAFFTYVCWGIISDIGVYAVRGHCPFDVYLKVFTGQLVVDSSLMFTVLVELLWGLLSPIRAMLSRRGWIVIAMGVILVGLLLWPAAGWAYPARLSTFGSIFFRMQQDFALLRVVIFLGMAGCSHALNLNWRNRELQLATGLGAYSLVTLVVTILHTHQLAKGRQYFWFDAFASVSYILVLIYWVACFASKEEERKEFTPQMRQFLLAAAGATRATRVALQSDGIPRRRQGRD